MKWFLKNFPEGGEYQTVLDKFCGEFKINEEVK